MSKCLLTEARLRSITVRAERWVEFLLEHRVCRPQDYNAVALAANAAFTLYALSWGPSFDPHDWQWPWSFPKAVLDLPHKNPWDVLFQFCLDTTTPKEPADDSPPALRRQDPRSRR